VSDSWRPSASIKNLRKRASYLATIRGFFAERGVLEVETPSLSPYGVTDPCLSNMAVDNGVNWQLQYLQTSPEYYMKRLLAAGSGDIYQMSHAFRPAECGALHQPEFSMLEWYRLGFDHLQLMQEVENLCRLLASDEISLAETEHYTYRQLFVTFLGIDPFLCTVDELTNFAETRQISFHGHLTGKDQWLDLLLTHEIEPQLKARDLCFVTDYPASQASLAKIRQDEFAVAERFELYFRGVELANGFHELTNASEQQARFTEDIRLRQLAGQAQMESDVYLLAALKSGLPKCAGVAIGLDRLFMLLLEKQNISQVMAFAL
jgi:elongation factor P--(R)-beta-lysine ligase